MVSDKMIPTQFVCVPSRTSRPRNRAFLHGLAVSCHFSINAQKRKKHLLKVGNDCQNRANLKEKEPKITDFWLINGSPSVACNCTDIEPATAEEHQTPLSSNKLKARKGDSCGARNFFACRQKFRPLRPHRLALSATGGASALRLPTSLSSLEST